MKPPPLLLTFALVLWGWQTGLLAFALLMAVVLEAARWIEWRVDFGVKDFNRIVDLAGLLAVIGGIYCVLTREATNQVMAMLQATNFTSQTKVRVDSYPVNFYSLVATNTIQKKQSWFPKLPSPIIKIKTWPYLKI